MRERVQLAARMAQQRKQRDKWGRRAASAAAAAAAAPPQRAFRALPPQDEDEGGVAGDAATPEDGDAFHSAQAFDQFTGDDVTELRQMPLIEVVGMAQPLKRGKATRLLSAVVTEVPDTELGWTVTGDLIIDGHRVRDSNMAHILNNAFNKKPNPSVPGYNNFIDKIIKYDIDMDAMFTSPAKLARQAAARERLRPTRGRIETWDQQ